MWENTNHTVHIDSLKGVEVEAMRQFTTVFP